MVACLGLFIYSIHTSIPKPCSILNHPGSRRAYETRVVSVRWARAIASRASLEPWWCDPFDEFLLGTRTFFFLLRTSTRPHRTKVRAECGRIPSLRLAATVVW